MENNNAGIRWLYAQLPDLTGRGVLTAESAVALREHYGALKARAGLSMQVAVTAVLGALLIGGGIILLLAANWD